MKVNALMIVMLSILLANFTAYYSVFKARSAKPTTLIAISFGAMLTGLSLHFQFGLLELSSCSGLAIVINSMLFAKYFRLDEKKHPDVNNKEQNAGVIIKSQGISLVLLS